MSRKRHPAFGCLIATENTITVHIAVPNFHWTRCPEEGNWLQNGWIETNQNGSKMHRLAEVFSQQPDFSDIFLLFWVLFCNHSFVPSSTVGEAQLQPKDSDGEGQPAAFLQHLS